MSVVKTKCPGLSDLSKVLGPIDGVSTNKPLKPLCENIFDVQRSELFEVLESLRNSFWDDNITTEPILSQPAQFAPTIVALPSSPSKRPHESTDDETSNDDNIDIDNNNLNENKSLSLMSRKRARLTTPQVAEPPASKKKTIQSRHMIPPTSRSLNTYNSLWPAKQSFMRAIKSANSRDSDVMAALASFFRTKPSDQRHHMALYLMPVAQAMRRKAIVDMLQKN